MAKLLISVRDQHEAVTAESAGADIVDIKEPTRGSLGAADIETVRHVIAQIDGRLPVSMACGELSQAADGPPPCRDIPVRYAKIGMSGYRNRGSWLRDWSHWCRSLSAGTEAIAVVYADTLIADAPPPLDIVSIAARMGCVGVLIDTFNKQKSRSLLDCCDAVEIIRMIQDAQEKSLFVAIAGSLSRKSIPTVLAWEPDIIAVRGAACTGNRLGRVESRKVSELAAILADHVTSPRPAAVSHEQASRMPRTRAAAPVPTEKFRRDENA